ncbi:MAG TPA: HAMP domain-containing sensor histidine kinase [Polyangiaceae bacterium]|nr:HAMP domain-containing sensor histidine kinase [Polyangiaceae bacterium]
MTAKGLGIAASARPTDHSLATRLAWITGLRLGFLVLLLGATATLYLNGELNRYSASQRIVLVTIGAGFAIAGVYATVLRRGRHLAELAWAQIAFDQVTWTAIVYVTGGPASGATSLYALTCLVGAILVGRRGAAVAAAIGIGAYGTLCAALHFGWVGSPSDQAPYAVETSVLVYPLLLNTLGVTVVALLADYLAERLRLTGGELQAATRRAYEAERLAVLGRVAAGLAHEIRNPLGSIQGSIEMLRESPALSEDDRKLCDIIRREARRLNDLVGDMVDLSKPRPPHAEATDVASLAREVVALAANAARGSDVRVTYDGPDGPAVARCDAAQMRQVLWNLVRNAIQASGAGCEVTVRVLPHERDVTFEVDDEGPGVPETAAARIFDDFFTTRTHGAGIGLAVVRRIMEDHSPMGATLAVERAQRGGASFRVTLSRDVAGLRPSYRPPPGPA